MASNLILHELTGSPNNVKVRIALGYKGLEYDRRPIDLSDFPGDRGPVVQVSQQPRLPVLQDGNTVMFDSAGIIRYLEANYPDTPSLFVKDYAGHGEIEQWETFAKTQLGEPIGMLFTEAFNPAPDTQVIAKANDLLHERGGVLEDKLNHQDYLVADHMTMADIACVSPLYLADMTAEQAQSHPIANFFYTHCKLGEGREKTRAWVRRVMAHDAVLGRR